MDKFNNRLSSRVNCKELQVGGLKNSKGVEIHKSIRNAKIYANRKPSKTKGKKTSITGKKTLYMKAESASQGPVKCARKSSVN